MENNGDCQICVNIWKDYSIYKIRIYIYHTVFAFRVCSSTVYGGRGTRHPTTRGSQWTTWMLFWTWWRSMMLRKNRKPKPDRRNDASARYAMPRWALSLSVSLSLVSACGSWWNWLIITFSSWQVSLGNLSQRPVQAGKTNGYLMCTSSSWQHWWMFDVSQYQLAKLDVWCQPVVAGKADVYLMLTSASWQNWWIFDVSVLKTTAISIVCLWSLVFRLCFN